MVGTVPFLAHLRARQMTPDGMVKQETGSTKSAKGWSREESDLVEPIEEIAAHCHAIATRAGGMVVEIRCPGVARILADD